jgi:hypothetical protein
MLLVISQSLESAFELNPGPSMNIARSSPGMLLVLALCGCSSSTDGTGGGGGGNIASAVGTYDGVSANGTAFPLVVANSGGCVLTALGGTSTLTVGARFTTKYNYHRQCGIQGQDISRAIAGSFSVEGANILFTADSGFQSRDFPAVATATLSGSTMTARASPTNVSIALILRRR